MWIAIGGLAATAVFLAVRLRAPKAKEMSEYHDGLDALQRIDQRDDG